MESLLLFPWKLKSKFNMTAQAMNIKIINMTATYAYQILAILNFQTPAKLDKHYRNLDIPQTGHLGISSVGIFMSFCWAIISRTKFSLSYVF